MINIQEILAGAQVDESRMVWISQRKWAEMTLEIERLRKQLAIADSQIRLLSAQGRRAVMRARGVVSK